VFHQVNLKPGKPLWFGVARARNGRPGALVFGLPGNPVSGLVGFMLFVRPALGALAGRLVLPAPVLDVQLESGFAQRGNRVTYFPSRMVPAADPSGASLHSIKTLDWAGSADLCTVASADGFAIFPAGDRDYVAGDIVGFLPMRSGTS
jgi:molybdopterin molybdotransferase